MLIDQMTNPLFRFWILSPQGQERQRLAKQAFLFVIGTQNAVRYQKAKILNGLIEECPHLLDTISDEEMSTHFQAFYQEAVRRGEVVSTCELRWVSKYVRDPEIRTQIEKMIYRRLLGSSFGDRERLEYRWTISFSEKQELAREVLLKHGLGSMRKMELAQEFGEPHEEFLCLYYKKLLYDRHYDKAESLGVSYPDVVEEVVVANLDAGYFQDALDVAVRFLLSRVDLAEEIQQMIATVKAHS